MERTLSLGMLFIGEGSVAELWHTSAHQKEASMTQSGAQDVLEFLPGAGMFVEPLTC
jgi:hypothetical protein